MDNRSNVALDATGLHGSYAFRSTPTAPTRGRKHRAFELLQRAIDWSGSSDVYGRFVRPKGAVIMSYHSVPGADEAAWIDPSNAIAPEVFRKQMRFLAAHRNVIAMSRLAEMLRNGESPRRGTVVLTFDDGYLDNLRVAAPILTSLRLPATFYLATGYVERTESQWVDRLYAAFRTRTREALALEHRVVTGGWALDRQSAEAYRILCQGLIRASWSERHTVLADVEQQLRSSTTPMRLTLSWDDVRALLAQSPMVEIGGHTADHIDLTAHDDKRCADEVLRCANDIERETGHRPEHFSFPYSRLSPQHRRMVEQAGFRSAIGGPATGLACAGTDLFALPRSSISANERIFRVWTSGTGPDIARRLGVQF